MNYATAIYTRKGITQENIFTKGERVLHIGSGSKRLAGAETVDVLALPGVDTVHDLEVFPWPYADNTFDVVYAHSVLEHMHALIPVMDEIWRILKPKGRVVLSVPYFRSVDAFSDPTHVCFFTSQSLDSVIVGRAKYSYTNQLFTEVGFWYGWPQVSRNPLVRLGKSFIHTHRKVYDSHLSLLAPVAMLIWELEK